MIFHRFALRFWLRKALPRMRPHGRASLLTVLDGMERDAASPELPSWSGTIEGWREEFEKRYDLAGAPAGPLTTDWRQQPPCAACAGGAQRVAAHGSERLQRVLSEVACRACRSISRRLDDNLRGLPKEKIVVAMNEGDLVDDADFGLPCRAWMEFDAARPVVRLAFSRDWIEERVADQPRLPDQGIEYVVWHEVQHALDHASDRRSYHQKSGSDHIFAEGFMDQVATLLLMEDLAEQGAENDYAIERARRRRFDAEEVSRKQPAFRAGLANARYRGARCAIALYAASGSDFDEDLFWRVTMAVYGGPVDLGLPERKTRWREQLVIALEDLTEYLFSRFEARWVDAALGAPTGWPYPDSDRGTSFEPSHALRMLDLLRRFEHPIDIQSLRGLVEPLFAPTSPVDEGEI